MAKGKSIDEERRLLATLDENMKFKGCPTDRAYARKVGRPLHLLKTQAFQSRESYYTKANLPVKLKSNNQDLKMLPTTITPELTQTDI